MNVGVALVGARGRAGRAIAGGLDGQCTLHQIDRLGGEPAESVARRAVAGAAIVINAAGVAHVVSESPDELVRLQVGNIDLPLALATAALAARAHFVHISSVKAVADAETAYGRSKFDAEQALERTFGNRFEQAGLGLVLVRPLALLLPPFEAGRLHRLRWLGSWPSVLTPPIRVPALPSESFVSALISVVDELTVGGFRPGVDVREFARSDRATLRDVRRVMEAATATP